jgi:hypothetical protein
MIPDLNDRVGWALPADILNAPSRELAAALRSAAEFGVMLIEVSLDRETRVPAAELGQLAIELGLRFTVRLRPRSVDRLSTDLIKIIREIGCSHLAVDIAAGEDPDHQFTWLHAAPSIGLLSAAFPSVSFTRSPRAEATGTYPFPNESTATVLELNVNPASAANGSKRLVATGTSLAYLRLSLSNGKSYDTGLDFVEAWSTSLAACEYDGPVVCEAVGNLEAAMPLVKAARRLLRRAEKREWEASFRA